jgi:tripartite ATP-independent transporter DctM subunit
MGVIALPEMKRFNYSSSLATGSVAAGGTLGILIPPSLGFMLYGIITEQSIGKLFMAGIIPGIILAGLFTASILIRCRLDPQLGPPGERASSQERIAAVKNTWPMLLLFIFVIGGIYLGFFNPTEAGAMGAFGAFVITIALKQMTWTKFTDSLLHTGKLTSMLFLILCGVKILQYFIASTKIPLEISTFVVSLNLSSSAILVFILILYVILGMLMNIVPMIMITLPIIYPAIIGMGFDPIWFGVLMVIIMEMGLITPPIGLHVFLIAGISKDTPMSTIFKGIIPFWIAQIIMITILILFPKLATFLPGFME